MLGSRARHLAVGTLAASAVLFGLCGPASSARPLASAPGTTVCKPFVGTKWVNPYPPNESGDHYEVIVIGKVFTCKSAVAYVKRFVAEKIKPSTNAGLPVGKVTGGPRGFVCSSGIGKTGTAYQGHCMLKKPVLTSSSFGWGPYKDS